MKLSQRSLGVLREIITGDRRQDAEALAPYRTLGGITDFFREFGERDIHPSSGAPSRGSYAKEKLEKFNGTEVMGKIICAALESFWGDASFSPENAAAQLNKVLRRDGYEVIIEERYLRMNGNAAEMEPYFAVRSIRSTVVAADALVRLSEDSITEHIAKANRKIETGDFAGAIASAYTLTEGLLKEILRKTVDSFNVDEGDIRQLYKAAATPLNLSPKGDHLEAYLKSILTGLQQQISGLYEVANKASDRHVRRYNPARHHAKLAVNTALTLCEFLLDSYAYQQDRKDRKQVSE